MGLVSSRLNLEGLHAGRRRSQQDETLYTYSLNKNYFSNYFLMGGERFEVNDPDYLFGDSCDLNFLSCTKPYSLPYKQAQQYLLSNLNTKQKAANKVSSRVNRLSSPFNILIWRHRLTQAPNSRKQDAQMQTLGSSKNGPNGSEPSKPLVMLVNIRKETLRLVKSSNVLSLDSDQNSLTNSISAPNTEQKRGFVRLTRKRSSSKHSKVSLMQQHHSSSLSTQSAISNRANTSETTCPNIVALTCSHARHDGNSHVLELADTSTTPGSARKIESDVSSMLSATSSTRSGYTSVKEEGNSSSYNGNEYSSEDDDEDFKDALNDTTNLSLKDDDDDESEKAQQQKSLLSETKKITKEENCDSKKSIETQENDDTSASNSSELTATNQSIVADLGDDRKDNANSTKYSTSSPFGRNQTSRRYKKKEVSPEPLPQKTDMIKMNELESAPTNRVYNIEFNFDSEVDCSIRIFYFCTREVTSNGITYKPQHATYKSKVYYYKKGLNQKFDQQEHTFQPYLFDEDLLIYKPLDMDGNYNSGAVFPIVIHCVALDGSLPKQSHSLVATIEKSQLDDSYSIKPLKQLIFVDGVQYILQDIYGIEHKQLLSSSTTKRKANVRPQKALQSRQSGSLNSKSHSLQSGLNVSNPNLNEDTTSMASVDAGLGLNNRQSQGSLISNLHKSLGSDNTFECVICMSEERDTMLLPCRHLCLCSSCAQSLRYQASSCPICRCLFKAALNLRPIQRHSSSSSSSSAAPGASSTITKQPLLASSTPSVSRRSPSQLDGSSDVASSAKDKAASGSPTTSPVPTPQRRKAANSRHQVTTSSQQQNPVSKDYGPDKAGNSSVSKRRESVTTSTTPLLLSPAPAPSLDIVVNLDSNGRNRSIVTVASSSSSTAASNYRPAKGGSCSGGSEGTTAAAGSQQRQRLVSSQAKTKEDELDSSSDYQASQGGTSEGGSLEMRPMKVLWSKQQ